jgi:hypothetical protein
VGLGSRRFKKVRDLGRLSRVVWAECRLCGYAGPFDTEGTDWDGAW